MNLGRCANRLPAPRHVKALGLTTFANHGRVKVTECRVHQVKPVHYCPLPLCPRTVDGVFLSVSLSLSLSHTHTLTHTHTHTRTHTHTHTLSLSHTHTLSLCHTHTHTHTHTRIGMDTLETHNLYLSLSLSRARSPSLSPSSTTVEPSNLESTTSEYGTYKTVMAVVWPRLSG